MIADAEGKFIGWYDQHSDAIFRYCFYRVGEKEKAKELTQETFMRLWKMLGNGKKIEYPKAILYRVARNLVIDFIRRKKELSLDAIQEISGDSVFANSPQATPSGENLENRVDVKIALTKLRQNSEETCEMVELRYIHGLRVQEIAELLDLKPNAVSVRIHRGIHYLKKLED
jgi:RNA polymerase sigma-70 factor (ECF subfamily)